MLLCGWLTGQHWAQPAKLFKPCATLQHSGTATITKSWSPTTTSDSGFSWAICLPQYQTMWVKSLHFSRDTQTATSGCQCHSTLVISQNVNAGLANRSHSSRINRIRFQPLPRFTTLKHGVVYFLTVQCKNNSMQEGKQNREWNRLNSNCKLLLAGETCSAVATPAATQQILYCAKGRVVHCHNTNFARHHNFEFWSAQCWPEFPLLSIQRINVTKLTRYVCT